MRQFILLFCISIYFNPLQAQTTLNPCAQAQPVHVVVLGSSTAAGTGPSSPDSTWVNRYRNYLQSINAQNQVTNLAQGGTTTYQIMPDWFVPPANRPATNSARNVTHALNLGADAIIVNMPSNDAARNYNTNEQLFNFIAIQQTADSVGVPVWVCTTQPRKFGTAQKAIQISVRDSVLSYFGAKAIDFWSGFADSLNDPLAQYDSGDGVHLNDAAHRILWQRVIAEGVPNFLADTLPVVDHQLAELSLANVSACGDSNTQVQVKVVNLGPTSTMPIEVNVAVTDRTTNMTTNTLLPLGTLGGCSLDSVSLTLNAYNGVSYDIQAYLVGSDLNKTNDTSGVQALTTQGHPTLSVVNDTVCEGDDALLQAAIASTLDTVLWYDAPTGGNLVSMGKTIMLEDMTSNQTFYPEAVRGDLFFKNTLFTTSTTTTNFNGIMFNIIALDTITLDSLSTRINSTGQQAVLAYQRQGSYVSHENNINDWNIWGLQVVQVANAGDFKNLNYPDITLYPQDTLGVYLHMQQAGANLSYQSVPNPIMFANDQVQVLSGSGIAHTFGTTYTPRNWSGELFYHYGFNPAGDCQSPRVPVHAIVSKPQLNLGADFSLKDKDAATLMGNGSFTSYTWNTGDTTAQLEVDSANLSLGANTLWLEATNKFGCIARDTIVVTLTSTVGLAELDLQTLKLTPNPSSGYVEIIGLEEPLEEVVVIDMQGKPVRTYHQVQHSIELGDLDKGVYQLWFRVGKRQATTKVVLY